MMLAGASYGASFTYSETQNEGNVRSLDTSFNINDVPFSTPYTSHLITPSGSDTWIISFTLNRAFLAQAASDNGPYSQTTNGKLEFTLTFDLPVRLSASITEGGTYGAVGSGTVSILTGGQVVAQDPGPGESFGHSENSGFAGGTTWSHTNFLGGSSGYYTTFKFSIDNFITATALPGAASSSAGIDEESFSVELAVTPLPLPTAEHAGLATIAIGGAGYLVRRRNRRAH
jgi:hypothetical protein